MVRAEMNSQYRISVIVPVYNKKKYLGACVDSILGQTYRNLELVLVDDASTDGSGALCDQYAAKDDRVRVIHRQNGGPTAACVTGMEQAGGSHFMFIDSDDYVDPCMLEEMGKHLTGRTGEIVCCDHVLEKRKRRCPWHPAQNRASTRGQNWKRRSRRSCLAGNRGFCPCPAV